MQNPADQKNFRLGECSRGRLGPMSPVLVSRSEDEESPEIPGNLRAPEAGAASQLLPVKGEQEQEAS